MNHFNDLCTPADRLAQMQDPLEMESKRILTDAWPVAFMLAVVLILGFAMGYHAGFRDGAEISNTEVKAK